MRGNQLENKSMHDEEKLENGMSSNGDISCGTGVVGPAVQSH
jgi:hypothetical protein